MFLDLLFWYICISKKIIIRNSDCFIHIKASERCYCANENGGPGKSGIMCGFDGIFKMTTECSLDEWCTGPANETTAVLGSSQLCKKGDTVLSKL